MTPYTSETTRSWVTNRLNRSRQATTQKWIRVRAGQRPPFRFQISYGKDSCAQRGEYMGTSYCTGIKRVTKSTVRYVVPTTR